MLRQPKAWCVSGLYFMLIAITILYLNTFTTPWVMHNIYSTSTMAHVITYMWPYGQCKSKWVHLYAHWFPECIAYVYTMQAWQHTCIYSIYHTCVPHIVIPRHVYATIEVYLSTSLFNLSFLYPYFIVTFIPLYKNPKEGMLYKNK